ncbi:MAG: hypothetical protein ABIJ85_00980 [bacterium]
MLVEQDLQLSKKPLRDIVWERSHDYGAKAANEEVEVVINLAKQASLVVGNAAALPENLSEKRKGGILAIGLRDASWAPISRQIGEVRRRKVNKYTTDALEKADRLIKHESVAEGIAFENGWVVSFFGFAPDIDEAVVLAIGIKLGFTTEQKTDKLAIELGNKSWKEVKVKLLQAGQNIT